MDKVIRYPRGYKIYPQGNKWYAEAPDGEKISNNVKRGAELQIRHHETYGRFFGK